MKLPIYNAYVKQVQMIRMINESDGKKLTLNEILDFFYRDPLTDEIMLQRSTARKWIANIQEKLQSDRLLKKDSSSQNFFPKNSKPREQALL